MKYFLFLFIILWSGCQIAGPDDPRTQSGDDYRAKWDAFQDGTYYYTLNRSCFCLPGGRMQVQVIDGEVTSAFYLDRTEELPSDHFEYIETINDMFDFIEQRQEDAYVLDAEYSESGYPTSITFDGNEQIADDELWLEVTDLHLGVK